MNIHVNRIVLPIENKSLCRLYELQLGKAVSMKPVLKFSYK